MAGGGGKLGAQVQGVSEAREQIVLCLGDYA